MENNNNNPYCKPFTEIDSDTAQSANVNAVPRPPYMAFTQTESAQNTVQQPKHQNVDYSYVSYERYENPTNNVFEKQQDCYQNNKYNRMGDIPPQPYPYGFVHIPVEQNDKSVFYQQGKEVSPDMNNNIGNDNFSQPDFVRDFRANPINPQNAPNMQNMYGMNGGQQPYGPQRPNHPTEQGTYLPNMPYPVTFVAPCIPPQEKKKLGGGVIAIIVILSVLFVGSLIGILVFALNSNSETEGTPDSSFDFTIPESGEYDFNTNYQSDYSDKVNPDYKGIDLKAKPENKADVKYNAEYANSVVSDSVVAVLCYYGEVDDSEDYASEGSGIIITDDGYVVTNSHVIDNSRTAYGIEIVTADGTRYTAGVVGFDERTDLALLKMDDAKNLKVADFCNVDQVALGEEVICVGNPGGIAYSHSVTKGIVSAVNRRISNTNNVKYIQTDAPINPGNSGGPVVNMYGQVIGIATSKIVSETYEGMGFAIPSNTVKDVIDEIMKNGYVSGRVKIGINGFNVTAQEASSKDVPQGIRIESISKGGPCDGSGLKKDDIITKADGKTVKSFADFYDLLSEYKAGDEIEITYYRPKTKKTETVKITLQAAE